MRAWLPYTCDRSHQHGIVEGECCYALPGLVSKSLLLPLCDFIGRGTQLRTHQCIWSLIPISVCPGTVATTLPGMQPCLQTITLSTAIYGSDAACREPKSASLPCPLTRKVP